MDVHVNLAIATGLRARNLDVLTIQEEGGRTLEDPSLLQRAAQLGRILFTQDQDFRTLVYEQLAQGVESAGVIYARQDRAIGLCIAELELIAQVVEPEELANRCVALPDFLL